VPRLIISALSGGAGKTILSLGLARYWSQSGLSVKPFKKGPDYIDAVWLGRAAGQTATNLDPFFMQDRVLSRLFVEQAEGSDVALIEGNRGLFDGKDTNGSCSTSHLARLLQAPVLLILDCSKMTRTVAPIVQGCAMFEKDLHLGGVILNRTAGARHRSILRKCLEAYTDVPVLGALPKLDDTLIPERHMGLVSDREYAAEDAIAESARILGDWVDVEGILGVGRQAPAIEAPEISLWPRAQSRDRHVRIGVVRDASLWFYYPENLQALERAGAELAEVSLLEPGEEWPKIHGLYLGGGFPEMMAERLAANTRTKELVRSLAEAGLPVYAECGGLMYLCSSLTTDAETEHPMADLFPLRTGLSAKPHGHGYTRCIVRRSNPFFPVGQEFIGHEFHYSRCHTADGQEVPTCLEMNRGTGLGGGRDGLLYKNTLACYTHLHALSVPSWAENFVRAATLYKEAMLSGEPGCPQIKVG
jgi:cobyrinic acid a,c-diamide synthase